EITRKYSNSLAHSWNEFTVAMTSWAETELAKAEGRIAELDNGLKRKSQQVCEYANTLQARDRQIEELRKANDGLSTQLEQTASQLDQSSARVKSVEGKCLAYKKHLNAAIDEQQTLYSRSKEQCKKAIDEIRASEQRHRTSMEHTKKNAEAVREQMSHRLQQTIAQNKQETVELYRKIQELTTEVDERDAELRGEKSATDALVKQLEDQRSSQAVLETLSAQMADIMTRLGEKEHMLEEQKRSEQEHRARLGDINDRLDSLIEATKIQPQLLSGLGRIHQDAVAKMSSALANVAEGQSKTYDVLSKLSENWKGQIDDMWQHLDSREDALTFQLNQRCQENAMLSTNFEDVGSKCNTLKWELNQAQQFVDESGERIYELEQQLAEIGASAVADSEAASMLEALQRHHEQLQMELVSKDSIVADLRAELRFRDEKRRDEAKEFDAETRRLNEMLTRKETASQVAAKEAVNIACRELRISMEESVAHTQSLLLKAEKDKSSLLDQLAAAKAASIDGEAAQLRDSAIIEGLKSSMAASELQRGTLQDLVNQQAEKLQAQAMTPSTMSTKLSHNQKRESELSESSWCEELKDVSVFEILHRWAQKMGLDEGLDIGTTRLPDGTISAHEIELSLAHLLEQLLSVGANRSAINTSGTGPFLSTNPEERPEQKLVLDRTLASEAGVRDNKQGSKKMVPDSSEPNVRHVIVRSPVDPDLVPSPPSVEQEKTRRREAVHLRSIMKPFKR
ncbi:hypothetical protein GQ53DRAFT_887238, partial [Thozetella sp. PMI_491]